MPYVRQADNKINGAIITFNDISELKKIQLKLDDTNKNLMRINADLDNFVLTASHDLLGPLSNIEVTINLLNDLEKSNPQLHEYLKIINNSVRKFRSLIVELSMIGKIESDVFKMEAVDVEKMIDEIVLSIENKIKSSKAIITTDLPIARIQFSKKNLRSILFNLISNSLKYKSDKHIPHIKITTAMEEDFVVLSVQDDGVGMSKNELHKIFNLYHQLQHHKEGKGIGLYLVKKVVEGAGGKIVVKSEPDKGCTFKIYFKAEPVMLEAPSLN
jgi:light-regulated signal transduction histidine kinase (bacteriophytochrome)